jgi:hypothetical protein
MTKCDIVTFKSSSREHRALLYPLSENAISQTLAVAVHAKAGANSLFSSLVELSTTPEHTAAHKRHRINRDSLLLTRADARGLVLILVEPVVPPAIPV